VSRVRAGVRRVPVAAWACALVALLSAACWSLVTPPLQGIDEPDHLAYVQELATNGRLPSSEAGATFSQEETNVYVAMHALLTRYKPQVPALASLAEQRSLERSLSQQAPPGGPVSAGTAGSEPPLYYALASVPYALGSAGSLLDRIELIRLLSALMAALAVLATFMFVREVLPGAPWAWVVGALGVALMPLLGYISGAVNPESTLVAVSATLFLLLARAFRRGLGSRLAVALGLTIAIGFLTKLNFVGLAPGAFLGLALLALRAHRRSPRGTRARAALVPAAVAAAIGLAPVVLYVLVNLLSGSSALGPASTVEQLANGPLARELSYVWQFYLPRLPGMHSEFPGILTTRDLWFDGLVGRFGWDDTFFPAWVYDAALVPGALFAVLGLRTLVSRREALRQRAPEIVVYAAMAVGLLALVGASSYLGDRPGGAPWWQPRYFLPLLPLFATALALAARGAGRRWGPVAGVAILVLLLAQDVFGQLQTIARYYG
jgi:4-amino-4-deoxy-L-arabinose transferase-like glycosyltransferase